MRHIRRHCHWGVSVRSKICNLCTRMWPKPRTHIPLLITGHPRCGTTSAGSICRSMNLDVGDEGVGKHGACSWMLAVDDRWSPYGSDRVGRDRRNLKWDWLLLVVRDLRAAVPSVILENRHASRSFAFRRKHILKQLGIDIAESADEFTAALRSILAWTRIITNQSPDFLFRIEDQQAALRRFVVTKLGIVLSAERDVDIHDNTDKAYQGQIWPKPEISEADWQKVSREVNAEVEWYCRQFGYPNPTGGARS